MKMDKATLARTIVLIVALLNQVLTSFNLNPLPFSDTQVYDAVTVIFTVVSSLVTWYKNNEIKKKGDTNAQN